ncbi:hypothetical protein QTP70_025941 [Hemibagrus guttatus]|uniref:Protein NPAT C-terminal domain-containing protein n=1 Tax=Hemibagrus guttatus TaxID=175788 RepID=A0AAE0V0E3_9TELE|nr:hypothetical protein QTP70_025941 [Hemibagrus guttatus]KAK3560990.1 hypothetical protein QTP86_023184 [Hemibagrus guttatus]
MLLPSDVARLVLGYLQQEGLSSTSRAFIVESPNLREYAEHSSEDGVIPACVFSLFGKNLTTILNEYVAAKAKETCQENQIPVVMTSLWKKLDFTLNQIKCMQNSPAVQQNQRLRTQNSIQNMRRQRALCSPQTPATGCLSVSSPGNCVPRAIPTLQGILGHSTPVCYTSQQTRPSTISLAQSEEAALQIMVPDQRFTPGPLSPARRKCDSPRRRGGQTGTSRGVMVTSMLTVESQNQEAVTENLSQMVIENAREKILNDRSLQEKLAENINKILASDNSPQTSKAVCNTEEQEQSIDEILGLQGEIHMTDDAIQGILEQTESDPAFQALFDLFDYGKNKMADGSENADRSNSAQESDVPGPIDSATDTGTGQEDSTSGGETTTRILRSKNVKEAKSKRKTAPPLSTSRPIPAASQSCAVTKQTATPKGITQNKNGSSRSRGSVTKKQTRGTSSSLKEQLINNPQAKSSSDPSVSSSSLSEEGVSMEVDDTTPDMSQECTTEETRQQVLQEISQNSTNNKNAPVSTKQAEISPKAAAETSGHKSQAEKAGRTQLFVSTPEASGQEVSQQTATNKFPLLNTVMLEEESSSNTTKTSSPAPSSFEPLPSVVSVSIATTTSSTVINPSQSQTAESDPNKIVSLKIIISDEQEQQGSDSALNQAVSSISGDRIPTIFLSPPAKSLTKVLPSTPGSSITPEETAQAVSSLQGAESAGDPAISVQNNLQPAQARPMASETGFIQLLPANPTFRGPSSYFVVTDPNSAVNQHSSMMLLPGGAGEGAVCSTPHVVATPPRPRTVVSIAPNVAQPFSPASAIIISSPVQPMIQNIPVPMSVLGQNNTGKFTVIPSPMLALPGSKLVNQSAKVVSKPKVVTKDNVELGKTATSVGVSNQVSDSSQVSEQLNSTTGASPSHRRILCFDENTSQTSTNAADSSAVMKDSTRTERTLPSILGNANAKRRVETIRLSEPSQSVGTKEPEMAAAPQQQKEATKSTRTEIGIDRTVNSSTSLNNAVQQNPSGRLESKPTEGDSASFSNAEHSLKSSSQNPKPKSTSITKDTSQEEKHEQRHGKTPEKPSESNVSQDSPNVAANKENEVEGGQQELCLGSPPILSTVRSTPASQGISGKPICKTSPLTKQAVEMLQDIQSQSPISTPPRRRGTADVPLPKTPVPGRLQEDLLDGLRTPLRQRHGREGEGTPKHLVPPATPDLPTCSPASEAGSENSINMAAHTLMILSRAARTGGPLKDSLRQEEAGAAKSSASKGKKRKHTEPSPTPKKELHLTSSSGSKKKAKKQKKLLDSFPHDLDVDKFLSSLHYDE